MASASLHEYKRVAPPLGFAADIRDLRAPGRLLEGASLIDLSSTSVGPKEDEADVVTFGALRERNRQFALAEAAALKTESDEMREKARGHRGRFLSAQKHNLDLKERWRDIERARIEREQDVVRIHKEIDRERIKAVKVGEEEERWREREDGEQRAMAALQSWQADMQKELLLTKDAFVHERWCNRFRNALCWCFFMNPSCCCKEGRGWCCRGKISSGCYKEPLAEWKRRLQRKAEKEALRRAREEAKEKLRRRSDAFKGRRPGDGKEDVTHVGGQFRVPKFASNEKQSPTTASPLGRRGRRESRRSRSGGGSYMQRSGGGDRSGGSPPDSPSFVENSERGSYNGEASSSQFASDQDNGFGGGEGEDEGGEEREKGGSGTTEDGETMNNETSEEEDLDVEELDLLDVEGGGGVEG